MGRSKLILVTGGAGFIGSHLVHHLLDQRLQVRVLDDLSTGYRRNLVTCEGRPGFEFVEGDVRDARVVSECCDGVDAVFHLAALGSVPRSVADPVTTHDVNATGTLRMLEAAHKVGVERFVYASSSSVYGGAGGRSLRETRPLNPKSPYAASKACAEMYSRAYAAAFGLHTVGLRLFNVFGPRQDAGSQYAAAIPRFLKAMSEGRAPTVFGNGEQTRDFTYVDNVLDLFMRAWGRDCPPGSVYNGGCGASTSINGLLALMRELTAYRGDVAYMPSRLGEVLHSQADIGAARHDLGYEPKIDFAHGLASYVQATLSSAKALADLPVTGA